MDFLLDQNGTVPTAEGGCSVESDWLPCSENIIANIFLMIFYGYLLGFGSKLIADGSELLLDILNPGLIGGFVIPFLGAMPDAIIVIVSGLGAAHRVEEEVKVGVGTLAGSTIMLLTIAWGGSVLIGRCDINDGEAVDKTRTNKWSLISTGVSCEPDMKIQSRIMLGTSLTYLIIQAIAWVFTDKSRRIQIDQQEEFALAGFVVAMILFIAYSMFMVLNTEQQEREIEKAQQVLLHKNIVKVLEDEIEKIEEEFDNNNESMVSGIQYLHTSDEEAQSLISAFPQPGEANQAGIDIGTMIREQNRKQAGRDTHVSSAVSKMRRLVKRLEENEESTPVEEEEEAEEEVVLTKRQILIRSPLMLLVATVILSVFADGMVKAISNFANGIGIDAFYISFVVTPFASNASELIASLIFAAKMKKKNMTITFGAIYGAAIMNNTLVLGIFLALVYFRKILWTFSAEVITVVTITFIVGLLGSFMTTFRAYWSLLILALFPLSIALVALLRTYVVAT